MTQTQTSGSKLSAKQEVERDAINLPEYEQKLALARDQADEGLILQLTDEYTEARAKELSDKKAREKALKARQEEEEE